MKSATRVAINSLAQYLKTIINVVLGFYCTRIVLVALGENDFGIYSLVGSVVAILAFVNSALSSTTQRYLSYHQTKSDINFQKQLFSNSLLLLIGLGLIVVIALEILGLFLFDGLLNISPDRISAAKTVFHCTVMMVFVTLLSSPFSALLVAHENLVYTSIVGVLDGILKVIVAYVITDATSDRLIIYAELMLVVWIINFLFYLSYSMLKYDECIFPRFSHFSIQIIKDMGSFASWTLYGMGCVVGRLQGIAIVLNRFFGTVMNASLGVALQVNSAIQFVSSSLLNAINPQIVKAEGAGNRTKMLTLSMIASRMSFFLLAAVIVPLCFYTPLILQLWLGRYPEYSVLFCRIMLLSSLCDSLTTGLGTANQALGRIRNFTLIVYSIKLLTLPVVYLLLWYFDVSVEYAMFSYVLLELISALIRIPLLGKTAGLKPYMYVENVLFKVIIPLLSIVLMYSWILSCSFTVIQLILAAVIITIIYVATIFLFGLTVIERDFILNILKLKAR